MERENKNYFERLGRSIKASVTLKLLSIFILMLLLLIPLSFVESLIKERESLRQQTVTEVSSKWANSQEIYGPILTIPVQKRVQPEDGTNLFKDEIHILPSQLNIQGIVTPRKLKRGIYEVVVYDAEVSFSGNFDSIQKVLDQWSDYEVALEEAFLTIHISDLRGIREKVTLQWNDLSKQVSPGSAIPVLIPSGITVKDLETIQPDASNAFAFDLQLQGSEHLGFVPLGKETTVKISSNWQDPSFSGAFLPVDRSVTEAGFEAEWKVLELNRNYPQFWLGNAHTEPLKTSAFGVDLLLPATDYQKAMRSAKYGLLAISLTFLTFFLVEIFNKRKLHPFQYILIGLALVLFYTLLVSISEHTTFNSAYLISSGIIIGMIALYAKAILQSVVQTLVLVIILCFTYAFVFVTLQLQDYALLIGSVGLTAILAFTMYITRKINWYALSSEKSTT